MKINYKGTKYTFPDDMNPSTAMSHIKTSLGEVSIDKPQSMDKFLGKPNLLKDEKLPEIKQKPLTFTQKTIKALLPTASTKKTGRFTIGKGTPFETDFARIAMGVGDALDIPNRAVASILFNYTDPKTGKIAKQKFSDPRTHVFRDQINDLRKSGNKKTALAIELFGQPDVMAGLTRGVYKGALKISRGVNEISTALTGNSPQALSTIGFSGLKEKIANMTRTTQIPQLADKLAKKAGSFGESALFIEKTNLTPFLKSEGGRATIKAFKRGNIKEGLDKMYKTMQSMDEYSALTYGENLVNFFKSAVNDISTMINIPQSKKYLINKAEKFVSKYIKTKDIKKSLNELLNSVDIIKDAKKLAKDNIYIRENIIKKITNKSPEEVKLVIEKLLKKQLKVDKNFTKSINRMYKTFNPNMAKELKIFPKTRYTIDNLVSKIKHKIDKLNPNSKFYKDVDPRIDDMYNDLITSDYKNIAQGLGYSDDGVNIIFDSQDDIIKFHKRLFDGMKKPFHKYKEDVSRMLAERRGPIEASIKKSLLKQIKGPIEDIDKLVELMAKHPNITDFIVKPERLNFLGRTLTKTSKIIKQYNPSNIDDMIKRVKKISGNVDEFGLDVNEKFDKLFQEVYAVKSWKDLKRDIPFVSLKEFKNLKKLLTSAKLEALMGPRALDVKDVILKKSVDDLSNALSSNKPANIIQNILNNANDRLKSLNRATIRLDQIKDAPVTSDLIKKIFNPNLQINRKTAKALEKIWGENFTKDVKAWGIVKELEFDPVTGAKLIGDSKGGLGVLEWVPFILTNPKLIGSIKAAIESIGKTAIKPANLTTKLPGWTASKVVDLFEKAASDKILTPQRAKDVSEMIKSSAKYPSLIQRKLPKYISVKKREQEPVVPKMDLKRFIQLIESE